MVIIGVPLAALIQWMAECLKRGAGGVPIAGTDNHVP